MLVFPDGRQVGTLGGGCVEAEVKRQALAHLGQTNARVVRFQLDHDYGWDDGLICGGRMDIVIDAVDLGDAVDYYRALGEAARSDQGLTEAVIVQAGEDAAASSLLLGPDGTVVARRQASDHDEQVVNHLRPLTERPRPYEVEGCAYLPSLPRCRLLIIGGGHVGQAVAQWANPLDFDVWVVDDREEYVSAERFPQASRRISGAMEDVLPTIHVDSNTYGLIVTRGHSHDQQALFLLAERPFRYLGMIGSRRKIRLIFDNLLQEGVPQETLDRVYAPLGIDIGSQTVPEIAISICGELVSHRNRQGSIPGK